MVTCMRGTSVNQHKINDSPKHLSKKVDGADCTTTTVSNRACHAGHCHNSTTYIHGCDTYDQQWDNLTVNYNIHNTTGWSNTTCNLYASWNIDTNNLCGYANLTFTSCTNGDCRNGTIEINACLTPDYKINNLNSASNSLELAINDGLGDFFGIPCVNLLYDNFRRQRFHNSIY
ncbi:unnamed protein product [Adineta steineri]|uniref:Uncharacterized protein n=1 Tax=Adineta steineri TaxID=433720 RepID=A0A813ZKZ3_9BILA|nr:unnamed protein product [Adineta steineri]